MDAPTIVSTVTAVPSHSSSQEEMKSFLRTWLPLKDRRLEAALSLLDHSAIERRYSVQPLDFLREPRSLTETTETYRDHAIALGRDVASRCLEQGERDPADVDLLITVSCTGFMIPSLDAHLVNELGFRSDVRRLPITELGCVGGASALARARDFLLGLPDARVLVVAVELPSLSLRREDVSPATLVSTALFGDGAAAALLEARRRDRGVRILDTLSHIFPRSTWALGFDLQDDGFHSVLSKEVPVLLKTEIARLVRTLAERRGLDRDQLSCWVVHPGGRKILTSVEEELGLGRDATQPSWDVLRLYGNQSSASVLFVLHEWLTKQKPAPGSHGVLAAFGPGLSTEMLLLQWN
jgi:alkylresorcinol/alkylpyrone synthase